jgi:glycosyltransferase involved in cell wall biosynthesis
MMKPKIAVVHQHLVPGGGSEACTLWMTHALQDEAEVTLITMGEPDLGALNRAYGTAVEAGRVALLSIAIPAGMRRRFDALRGYRLARYCRDHAPDFDLMISAYNVMDFGRIGIQRVGDFSFDDGLRRAFYPGQGAWGKLLYRRSPGRSLYLWLGRRLSGITEDGWRANWTVANSEWTRKILDERFGLGSQVVYPPVSGEFPDVPWRERENGFVVMGRLAPEKSLEQVIDILKTVRREFDVHLHVLGRSNGSSYSRKIEALVRENGAWASLEGPVYGEDKAQFLSRHKFGISGCRYEAFGIAVAEMVKAGCLVWVPRDGGQVEIVNRPELDYADRDEAVSKILALMRDERKADGLRTELKAGSERFSTGRFVEEIRAVVRRFLEGRP